ncbi:MAG: virulence protein SciE type, partial [Reyranella sp.]|nr:virulence protein SciE type [Reyranella sp.]
MSVQSLFAAGRLKDAIDALGQELRSHPTDPARRAFLFELCSFAGDWDKAGGQPDLIAQ